MSTVEIQARSPRKHKRKIGARAATVAAVKGKYARVGTSSHQFAAAKRRDINRENSKR